MFSPLQHCLESVKKLCTWIYLYWLIKHMCRNTTHFQLTGSGSHSLKNTKLYLPSCFLTPQSNNCHYATSREPLEAKLSTTPADSRCSLSVSIHHPNTTEPVQQVNNRCILRTLNWFQTGWSKSLLILNKVFWSISVPFCPHQFQFWFCSTPDLGMHLQ